MKIRRDCLRERAGRVIYPFLGSHLARVQVRASAPPDLSCVDSVVLVYSPLPNSLSTDDLSKVDQAENVDMLTPESSNFHTVPNQPPDR
jgi:hypothetical protein